MNLPESVPLPQANEFCKGPAISGNKRCLKQWTIEAFGGSHHLVMEALQHELGLTITFGYPGEPTCKELAAGWERAMARLGYTEIYYV